jgi:hypothetical protein
VPSFGLLLMSAPVEPEICPRGNAHHCARLSVGAVYLVDTDIVSVGASSKKPSPLLVAWMDQNSADLYMSVTSNRRD